MCVSDPACLVQPDKRCNLVIMKTHIKLIKAIRELGLSKLWLYARYQAGLRSGYYRRVTPSRRDDFDGSPGLPPFSAFPQVSQAECDQAAAAADEICRGRVRLFGGEPVPLNLAAGASGEHWTVLERTPPQEDLKVIWEPGRFGWALDLARGFAFSGDPVYAQRFWELTGKFFNHHPPNLGRQWQSAQEVAIRLMVLVFCDRVFASAPSSTPEQRRRLWQAVAEHASRIVPTLVYARAQNNNHLLSEAAGLFSAGLYLPGHPQAEAWRRLGWQWINWGLQHQISEFGTYMQHSVNYHRLMLQVALYVDHLRRVSGAEAWPDATRARLAEAARWLWALTDHATGRTPNLGANDSAYPFALTARPISDFRPVVEAAARAFLAGGVYAEGGLDELSRWFELAAPARLDAQQPQAGDMLRVESGPGCGYLHAAQFTDRPSHADQLHVDLWWRGLNIALDPGTYRYDARPPWDNALQSSTVHNTLTVNGQEQMARGGRFLWLDWAQAEVLGYARDDAGGLAWVAAEHAGYDRLGARHQRKLAKAEAGWLVTDTVSPVGKVDMRYHEVALSWLLPDWEWSFTSPNTLHLSGRDFALSVTIEGADHLNLVRAGETLAGSIPARTIWGWQSPAYTLKRPALQLIAVRIDRLPIELTSAWKIFE